MANKRDPVDNDVEKSEESSWALAEHQNGQSSD